MAFLEGLRDGACVLDGRGRVLHANASLGVLSEGDDHFPRVRSALAETARVCLRRSSAGADRHPALAGYRSTSVRTARGHYVLAPTLLPEGTAGPEPVVLVMVRADGPRFPSGAELRGRFGLTRRESEVALLLVRGFSNRGIAEHLFLSPFTVRHHAQRVLQKVGVRSRKVLLLHLLEQHTGLDPSTPGRAACR